MISEEKFSSIETDTSSSSKIIKVRDGVHFFLSQFESEIIRGANFEFLTLI